MKVENSKRLIERTLMDVTRHIRRNVERELWARAAGRCQFSGCNRILYKSPVTQERVNIAEKAHIYSFSCRGPRGRGALKQNVRLLNDTGNLMLICHDCHRKIDQEKDGGRYSVDLLRQWKFQHEKRVVIVTGIDPSKKSTVLLYGANIGNQKSPLQPPQAHWAMFPHSYPADDNSICLSMTWEGKDENPDYWVTEGRNLEKGFDRCIRPRIAERDHFSIFAFAPIPLLIQLGALLTDKITADVYQLRREPEQSWQWSEESHNTDYQIIVPRSFKHPPALIISLSAPIAHHRVTSVLGEQVAIWELTIDEPNNDFLKTRAQLSMFRRAARRLMVQLAEKHEHDTPLQIFPAMPVAAAVELGRVRMSKADMPWVIYDHNNKLGAFVKALEIGGNRNDK